MFETLAVVLGAVVGRWLVRAGRSLWWAALGGGLVGITATVVSGELEVNAALLAFDAGQAAAAAVLGGIVERVARRQRLSRPRGG